MVFELAIKVPSGADVRVGALRPTDRVEALRARLADATGIARRGWCCHDALPCAVIRRDALCKNERGEEA
jgi:hypothetical protein